MFDVGFWEMAVVAVVALLVLGPERLPRAARTAGLWMGRARRMLAEVKADIDREIRRSELEEMRQIGDDLKSAGSDLRSAAGTLNEDVEAKDVEAKDAGVESAAGRKPSS